MSITDMKIYQILSEELLDVPTLTVKELSKKHNVSIQNIVDQLQAGINVELEHTTNRSIATEIALDHLSEDPTYYTKLAKIELDT